jgi:hypothetical protein
MLLFELAVLFVLPPVTDGDWKYVKKVADPPMWDLAVD